MTPRKERTQGPNTDHASLPNRPNGITKSDRQPEGDNFLPANRPCSLETEYDGKLMTTAEAADFLRISPEQMRNLCSQGRVAYFKLGTSNRFRRSDLEKLLLRREGEGIHVNQEK